MVRGQTPTLYTSTQVDGALAEISFHWGQLSPAPSKPAALHRILLGTRKSIRLARTDLVALGVNWDRYTEIAYDRTQVIGAAVAHLECDGLIAPSARWRCDNVMVFIANHLGDDELATLLSTEEVDWIAWVRAHRVVA